MKMNRRYTLMTGLKIQESGALTGTYDVKVCFRPDGRNSLTQSFTFDDSAGMEVNCDMTGTVNYDKGTIQFNVIFTNGTSGVTYECSYGIFGLRFIPISTMNGRTKVAIEMEQLDLVIDPTEDFLIDLPEELVQDFSSVWKIDYLTTVSDAIKRQIMLNKDQDLAFFLNASESDMAKNGAAMEIDLDQFRASASNNAYQPNTVLDVLKNVIPYISTMISTIRRNYNMYRAPMWLN